jgi:poly-gamma-glutamate synthesis protein (capsule biosynthesis protein)
MKNECIPKALPVLVLVVVLCISAGTVSDEKTCGIATKATAYAAQEPIVAQMINTTAQSRDLTEAFDIILQGATKEFIAGYVIDRSFLMWMDAQYGDDVIIALACHVLDGDTDANVWYELTGASIHVLWLYYCQETGFQNYQLERVYWMETADSDETVISFTGDFNLADEWCTTTYMESRPDGIYDCISQNLLEAMQDSDILLMNNEFVYSDKGTPVAGKDYTFRARPEMADLLNVFGADGVSLANNHVYDYGEEALKDTFTILQEKGIPYVGAGNNLAEASGILYYVANGQKIAIVSATEIERTSSYTREATDGSAGVLKTLDPAKFLQVIQQAKATSDYVIAVVHWGGEGNLYPDSGQQRLARLFAEAGADAIIGGHPHRLQGTWYVGDVPVAYSLGNFWFSDATLYTTLAQVVITKADGIRLRYLPCVQENLTTRLLTDAEEKNEFYQYLASISGDIGIDEAGYVYDKDASEYPIEQIVYDADSSTSEIRGSADNEGYAIDIVGNRK